MNSSNSEENVRTLYEKHSRLSTVATSIFGESIINMMSNIAAIHFTLFFLSCIFSACSGAGDVLSVNQAIKNGETIVSSGGVYELGFFSLGDSKNHYLSIRYKKAGGVIAWIANRDAPLTNASSAALTLSSKGDLKLFDATNSIIWSSNSTKSSTNPVAQLLDTGNLVIRTDQGDLLWQSFDFPGNTLLPGMKIGQNLANGLVWSLNSWKSYDDPSPGNIHVKLDISGYPQLFMYNASAIFMRVGSWNGATWSGISTKSPENVLVDDFSFEEEEIYYKYELVSHSLLIRIIIEPDGRVTRYTWTDQSNSWEAATFIQAQYCDGYVRCGKYSTCNLNSFCKCLDGFHPRNIEAWRGLNSSEGCVRSTELICSDRNGFVPYSNKKFPDTRRSWYNLSMDLEDCKNKCLGNCSCTAYANTNITGKGSGCLLWFGDLFDIRDQEQSGSTVFFVRGVASGSGSDSSSAASSSSRARRIVLVVVLPAVSILTIIGFCLRHVCKYKKKKRKGEVIEGEIDNEGVDLPLLDFRTIANATNNFSDDNKLGEGGFGPVYKGILEDGQEIAVKRRSSYSTQGVEEFKNEVSCIAKLQHRNLVRLLGWSSTEDGEKLLVYEYMPNKSLDFFIFGDIKERVSLDWPRRYNIINGIAKGLLYLHEDSRLRVVHRDLKASNILLDYYMNPKISDFGTARSFGDTETEANTARVVGTYGYMSPEYAIEGVFSVKSDVYSFGVLMIEIVSGKKCRFFDHPDHHHNLMGHAWMSYKEDKLSELIDGSILDSVDLYEAFRVILIGLLCVQHYPEDRPNMSSVLMMMTSNISLPHPKQPGFFTERKLDEADAFYNLLDSSWSTTVTIVEP